MRFEFRRNERLGLKAVLPAIPRECRDRVRTRYDSSFAYLGPKLWNLLPKSINLLDKLQKFKGELRRFVLSLPDKPPVHGYARENNNSLAEILG